MAMRYMASIDVSAATGTDYEVRKAKYEQLKADDQKNTDTKLYDDTLFTKDIIPVTGSNAASLWKERKSAKDLLFDPTWQTK